MKNFLQTAAIIAPIAFVLVGVLGFINGLFDLHLGLGANGGTSGVEAPRDPVINVFLILVGATIFLLPKLYQRLVKKQSRS